MAKRSNTGYRIALNSARGLVGLLLLILVVILIFLGGRTAYRFGYDVFHQVGMSDPPGDNITLEIPEDASVREMGKILENAGLVKSSTLFYVQERLSDYHTKEGTKLRGGVYRLNTSMTPDEILAVLAGEGESVDVVKSDG